MFLSKEGKNFSLTPLIASWSHDYSSGNTRDPSESGVGGFNVTSYLETEIACNKLHLIPSTLHQDSFLSLNVNRTEMKRKCEKRCLKFRKHYPCLR